MINMRLLGTPAALRAVSRSGTQVNNTLTPDDLNWCVNSSTEYAALAGLHIPDSRWIAYGI